MLTLVAIIILYLVSVAISQQSGCGKIHFPGSHSHTISHGGFTRTYIVHVPQSYAANTAVPVVFGLPGYTINANYFSTYFGLNVHSEQAGYLAVIAQGTSFQNQGPSVISWNDIGCSSSPGPEGCSGNACNQPICDNSYKYSLPANCPDPDLCNWCNCNADDVGFINYLAAFIETEYCIESAQQYVLGYSQGGMMAHRLACESNDRFAAAAPFAGQQPDGFNCRPTNGLPMGVINIYGTNDRTVPGNGDTSSDGYFYLPVADVQRTFAEYNGANADDGPYPVDAPAPNLPAWECSGYRNAAISSAFDGVAVMQCNYRGNHQYPKNSPNQPSSESNPNWAMPIVWEFFQGFRKPQINVANFTQLYQEQKLQMQAIN